MGDAGSHDTRAHRARAPGRRRKGRSDPAGLLRRRGRTDAADGRLGRDAVDVRPENSRPAARAWLICGLLLLASAINYMDRQTLANAAVRIGTQFGLNQEQYGNLELAFGWAFAAGSLVFGALADRIAVRWLYPIVLVFWSAAGFATGMIHSYAGLL